MVYILNSRNDIGATLKNIIVAKIQKIDQDALYFFPIEFFASTHGARGYSQPKLGRSGLPRFFFQGSQMELLFPNRGSIIYFT